MSKEDTVEVTPNQADREAAAFDRLSLIGKAHTLDPRHNRDCECHACWLVKELG